MILSLRQHADGNWLSNVGGWAQSANLRVRNLGWGRSPALPATSLVIGNLTMDGHDHILALKSLAGTLPIMLGDPRKLSSEERKEFRRYADWLMALERQHRFMSFRQDLPGFGEPATGFWDGFARINVDTQSGGLVGVFREHAAESSRTVTVRDLDPDATYDILCGPDRRKVATLTGRELEEQGFRVQLHKPVDGELYEITRVQER